jgi:hypothetical protein
VVVAVRVLLLTPVLAALVATPAACDPNNGPVTGGGEPYCDVIAEAPDYNRTAKNITGAGHFTCDRPGAQLSVTVTLQHQTPAGWVQVAGQQFSVAGAETTRDRTRAQRTRQISAACGPGAYRVFVTWQRADANAPQEVPGPKVGNLCP